eukprot:6199441-Pleurochrysis_carterae.AAC.1
MDRCKPTVFTQTPRAREHTLRKQNPNGSSFSLAADLLEISACIALRKGFLLPAAWDMAKASMFWLLHVGHLMLPGGCDSR